MKQISNIPSFFCAIYIMYEKILQIWTSLILIYYCDMLYFNSKTEIETIPIVCYG